MKWTRSQLIFVYIGIKFYNENPRRIKILMVNNVVLILKAVATMFQQMLIWS